MEAQRLTVGDIAVLSRRAHGPEADTNTRIALAAKRQARHLVALQIRKSFRIVQQGGITG